MLISLFVHDLAANPIARAAPVARALQAAGHEVELLGFLISGEVVYAPYRDAFSYRAIRASDHLHEILRRSPQLARMARGELIYAFKPLLTSYWPALLASGFGREKPLWLDVEDDELWFPYRGVGEFIMHYGIRGWNFANALRYRVALHPLTRLAHRRTVSSRKLQRRYGGTLLLHGPDESLFDPTRSDLAREESRDRLGLPREVPLLLFAGVPHPHKGLGTVVAALQQPQAARYHLVLAGPADAPEFQQARSLLGERCHLLGTLPNSRMPELLAAVDVVPTIQRANGYTEAQIPAKLIEAMAMAKGVVASRVSDLPRILGEGEAEPRGWLLPVGAEPGVLADLLARILANPADMDRRGAAARAYFLQHASTGAIARRLGEWLPDACG